MSAPLSMAELDYLTSETTRFRSYMIGDNGASESWEGDAYDIEEALCQTLDNYAGKHEGPQGSVTITIRRMEFPYA